jgi:hypothetical protein
MAIESWHLLAFFLIAVSVLLIADHLASQAHQRRIYRKRLDERINQLKRDARRRMAERPTMNTRGRAP